MIVVTGGTGHIGNVLVRQLLEKGEKVRVVIPEGENTFSIDGLQVEVIRGDVRDINSLIKAFHSARIVYHLGGMVSILPGKSKPLNDVNVIGTQNVIKACKICKVERLIYTSSIHAYEEPPHHIMIDEATPISPNRVLGDYAKSKAKATLEVLKAAKDGLNVVVVCPSGVIGPFDYKISDMGQLVVRYLKGNLKYYVEGAYNFVDVRDVARGHILACENGLCGECYILSGERVEVKKILSIMEEATGIKNTSKKVPYLLARISAGIASVYYMTSNKRPLFTSYSLKVLYSNSNICCNKAKKQLGYKYRSVKESINDSMIWFKENGYCV